MSIKKFDQCTQAMQEGEHMLKTVLNQYSFEYPVSTSDQGLDCISENGGL